MEAKIDFHSREIVKPLNENVNYEITLGPDQCNLRSTVSNSDASSMTHQFRVPIGSQASLLDRKIKIRAKLAVTVKYATPLDPGAAGTVKNLYGKECAFANYPIQQFCQNLEMQLNSNNLSVNMQDQRLLLNLIDPERMFKYEQYSPTMLDNAKNYEQRTGDLNNVLGGNNNTVAMYNTPRGAFPATITQALNAGGDIESETITAEFVECLLLSPFLIGQDSSKVLSNLNDITVRMQFGNHARPFRLSTAAFADTTVTCGFAEVPQLETVDYQQQAATPMACVAPYYEFMLGARSAVANFGQRVSTNTFSLSSLPDKLVICCMPKESAFTPFVTDHFIPITGINVQIGGRHNLGANFNREYLYDIARKRGYVQNYLQFKGRASEGEAQAINVSTSGGFIVLGPEDLGVGPGMAGGVMDQVPFDVSVQLDPDFGIGANSNATGANAHGAPAAVPTLAATDYEVRVYTISSGIITLAGGRSQIDIKGLFDQNKVLSERAAAASRRDDVDVDEVRSSIVGGSFLDSLKSHTGRFIKHAAQACLHGAKESAKSDLRNAMGNGMTAGGLTAGNQMSKYM